MRYTSYLSQCLNELEVTGEYDTDAKLVYLVRIQHLTERITQLHSPDTPPEDIFTPPPPPRSIYVPAIQGELDRIKASLPDILRSDSKSLGRKKKIQEKTKEIISKTEERSNAVGKPLVIRLQKAEQKIYSACACPSPSLSPSNSPTLSRTSSGSSNTHQRTFSGRSANALANLSFEFLRSSSA